MPYLDHLTIFVRDLIRSRSWYTVALGLTVEFEVPEQQATALRDSAGFTLFIEQRPTEQCTPSVVVTFRVDSVDLTYERLVAQGLQFEQRPQKLFWGYGAELRDPDGYLVRLWDEVSMRERWYGPV